MVAIGVGQNARHANGATSATAPTVAPAIPIVRSVGGQITLAP
jgi:hypothetical protein